MLPWWMRWMCALLGALTLTGEAGAAQCGGSGSEGILVTESSGSYTCRPDSGGRFPAVLYSHGGLGLAVGGDLQGTCEALAHAGYLAYAKLREDPSGKTIPGHLADVDDALDHLIGQTDADTSRVGIIGYSRGGALSYAIAEARADEIHATVLLAPAPAGNFLANKTADVTPIKAPILLGVARNDIYQADHVGIVEDLALALEDEGKSFDAIYYPPYPALDCGGSPCDGHEIFQVVDDEFTGYWCDVEYFLALHLGGAFPIPSLGLPGLALAAFSIFASGAGALWLLGRRSANRSRQCGGENPR